MADVPPILAGRLQELTATFQGNMACMLRGGFAPTDMMLRYTEHLELQMLKWQQFMARPATIVPDVAPYVAMADIVDISDDEEEPATAEPTMVPAEMVLMAVDAVAETAVEDAVAETAVEDAVAETAVEDAVAETAVDAVAAVDDNDDDGENAQRDPFMVPFSALDFFTVDTSAPLALDTSGNSAPLALDTSGNSAPLALDTSGNSAPLALDTSDNLAPLASDNLAPLASDNAAPLMLDTSHLDTSHFDISELDLFLQTLAAESSAAPAVAAMPTPLQLPSWPYAVYRYDPVLPPTPLPTPTMMLSKPTPQPPTAPVRKPATHATPEPKRHRNALQAINTGFSATDSTVEYLPDFEDTTPLLTTLLTRAPPKYAPPKFDVIRLKLK